MSIEFITMMLTNECMLMRSVLSADKTPHTNKEVYRYKVTARDVLSSI